MPEPFRMMMRSESSSATSALLVPKTVQASWMMCSAEQQLLQLYCDLCKHMSQSRTLQAALYGALFTIPG